MNSFSRNIRSFAEKERKGNRSLQIIFLIAIGYFFVIEPVFQGFLIAFVIFAFIYSKLDEKRIQRIKAKREGETICTFVRSIPFRSIDTWVIRAVWEEVQLYLDPKNDFPVRPTDSFEILYRMESEDVEDIGIRAAYRSFRSMENSESNPYYGKVTTVSDLVLFLNAQPKLKHDDFPL
ncbi:MAG: hypothetical protein F6K19_45170 [Cyanothece sp. SIO1E1]|nr:hypothetical protein [Cyanothece sp. SIO1E1]